MKKPAKKSSNKKPAPKAKPRPSRSVAKPRVVAKKKAARALPSVFAGKAQPAEKIELRPSGYKPGIATFDERAQPTRKTSSIKLGTRHRQDLGNVAALARDINVRGLLHPIVIDRDDTLIAGERRLSAWQHPDCLFNKEPIPVHVVPLADIIAGEWAENDPALRKDFTLEEAVDIKRAIEKKLRVSAKSNQAHGKTAPGRKSDRTKAVDENIRSGERASSFTGKSRRTIEKAEKIVDAAKENPAKFGKLKDDMNKSGRADGPFKRLQVMKAAEGIRKEPPPLPGKGPYRAIVADPPWAAEPEEDDPDRLARGYYPYPTMSIAEIAAVDVPSIAHEDCVLALWITNFHLVLGHHLEILKAWGFRPVTLRTWVKDKMGRGQVLRGKTEHCVFAVRGKPTIQVDNITTEFSAPIDKKQHSLKPMKFYSDFERLVAAPRYASLFETADRGAKWDGHGDKVKPKLPRAVAAAAEQEMIDESKGKKKSSPIKGKRGRDRGRDGASEEKNIPTPNEHGKEFPNGIPGHTVSMTIDWNAEPPHSVGTCECGQSWRASRELPMSGHEELDKRINAHWHEMSAAAHAEAAE